MAFQVSPGVQVQEVDLTNVVPAVSTSIGAVAGNFQWGPVEEVVQVTSEKDLVSKFGRPTDTTFKSFFNAALFLQYGNDLRVARTVDGSALNATSSVDSVQSITVNSAGTGYTSVPSVSFSGGGGSGAAATATLKVVSTSVTTAGTGYAVGNTTTLSLGNGTEAVITVASIGTGGAISGLTVSVAGSYTSISAGSLTGLTFTGGNGDGRFSVALGVNTVTVTSEGSGYTSAPTVAFSGSGTGTSVTVNLAASGTLVKNADDYASADLAGAGYWVAKYPGTLGNSLKVVIANAANYSHDGFSSYAGQFDAAPSGQELHIVVVDEDGEWSGVAGTILEKFAFVSASASAKKDDGTNNYYANVVNNGSAYVWYANTPSDLTTASTPISSSLQGGADSGALSSSAIASAYSIFADTETLDVNLIIGGDLASADANTVVAVAETRKDAVAFVSPEINDTVGTTTALSNVTSWSDSVNSSSYGVKDSGAVYVYDKYNDVYRWVAASGIVAGLCANTDNVADAWYSPAGFNRGTIRGVTKLAFNPKQAERDSLYKKGVNPIVSFPGEGIVLYGDKTALNRPSAFDRINVRRLFITIEKAIATAARGSLFEFNDEFTRAQFLGLVEPFLRDVQSRRGITDFKVVCDETNNTAQVIDTNNFVADIYIKPARSINFITLNFVATRTGVDFTELVGA